MPLFHTKKQEAALWNRLKHRAGSFQIICGLHFAHCTVVLYRLNLYNAVSLLSLFSCKHIPSLIDRRTRPLKRFHQFPGIVHPLAHESPRDSTLHLPLSLTQHVVMQRESAVSSTREQVCLPSGVWLWSRARDTWDKSDVLRLEVICCSLSLFRYIISEL